MHLISPILINSTRYCCTAPWCITEYIPYTDSFQETLNDITYITLFNYGYYGRVKVGVCCASYAVVILDMSSTMEEPQVVSIAAGSYIQLNGTTVYDLAGDRATGTETFDIAIDQNRPCGNIIDVYIAEGTSATSKIVMSVVTE